MTYNEWEWLKWAVDQAEAWKGSMGPPGTSSRDEFEENIAICRGVLTDLRNAKRDKTLL